MSQVTYFQRYTSHENAATNTTLHLFSQLNQHSPERLKQVLSEILGDVDVPLGITFEQQTRSPVSVPDGRIVQEPIHLALETKVDAGLNIDQLLRHCDSFEKGRAGNYLLLLTRNAQSDQAFPSVRSKCQELGIVFGHSTFSNLCGTLTEAVKDYEVHLKRVIDDYIAYCSDMGLVQDAETWMRIVPCGQTFGINGKWHTYYQPSDRGYSPFHYLGIYTEKAVRLVGRVRAVYDSKIDQNGHMALVLVEGQHRPEFHARIAGIINDSKAQLGWDLSSDYRFFCADDLIPTEFRKTSGGGIQGARFWDISDVASKQTRDTEVADALRSKTWE